MKPSVVYHPKINGVGVSACDPRILTKCKVGVILNTRWDARHKKLRAEAWLERNRVRTVDPRLEKSLERNEVVEVSTGLFVDLEQKEGVFNGRRYVAVAKNYRPDHLAILPDLVGACSVADGAGLLQVNAADVPRIKPQVMSSEHLGQLVTNALELEEQAKMTKKETVSALIANKATQWQEEDRKFLMGLSDGQLAKMAPVVNTSPSPQNPADGGKISSPDGTPVEPVTPQNPPEPKQEPAPQEPKQEPAPQKKADEQQPSAQPPVGNVLKSQTPAKPQTVEEFVANAPPEIRDLLQSGLSTLAAERQSLVAKITANSRNVFTTEFLATRSLDELKGIAALAEAPAAPVVNRTPSYFGAATPPGPPPVANAAGIPLLRLPSTAPKN